MAKSPYGGPKTNFRHLGVRNDNFQVSTRASLERADATASIPYRALANRAYGADSPAHLTAYICFGPTDRRPPSHCAYTRHRHPPDGARLCGVGRSGTRARAARGDACATVADPPEMPSTPSNAVIRRWGGAPAAGGGDGNAARRGNGETRKAVRTYGSPDRSGIDCPNPARRCLVSDQAATVGVG